MKQAFIYIVANERPTLYIGVTNNLVRRIYEHKNGLIKGFTQKYQLKKLLYYEIFDNITDAIAREKQLKHWNREWKMKLIREFNPLLEDLYSKII